MDELEYARRRVETAERQLAEARQEHDRTIVLLRSRLREGYDPSRCMEEVLVTVRYSDTRRQCLRPASPITAFSGLLDFCDTHRRHYMHIHAAVVAAERELEGATRWFHSFMPTHDVAKDEAGVYVVLDVATGRAKIGCTTNRAKRVGALRSGSAGELREIAWIAEPDNPYGLERHLHMAFAEVRVRPRAEWFDCGEPDVFREQVLAEAAAFQEDGPLTFAEEAV